MATQTIPAGAVLTEPAVFTLPDPPRPVVGVNAGAPFATVNAAAGPLHGERIYFQPAASVPAAWPAIPAGVTSPVISIKPAVAAVLAGSLDAPLSAFFAKAAAGSYVTLWHEGEDASNGLTAAQVLALHARAYGLFKAAAPKAATYCQIFTGFSATNSRVTAFTAPGLPLYCVDAYQQAASDTTAAKLGAWAAQVRAAVPAARLAVTETNSSVPGGKAAWLTQAWEWALSQDAPLFFPYFANATQEADLRWDPSDTAMIAALKEIAAAGG